MKSFNELKKNLKRDLSHLPKAQAALVGDTATQLLATGIKGMGVERGFNLCLWEAEYNQVERQFVDPSSELLHSQAKYIILFQATHKLLQHHATLSVERQAQLAQDRLDFVESCASHPALSNATIICLNYPEIDDTVFGSFANEVEHSFTYQVRKLNLGLMDLAKRLPNLMVCDIASVQNKVGRDFMFAPNVYASTDMVLSLNAIPLVASRIVDVIAACEGKLKKCIVLDLDGTLWGGVIGDDGIEGIQLGHGLGIGKAFSEFQLWVKKLRQRGIIVCVASKNDEATAKEPFLKHPDMVLRLDDIAVFMANWETKVDNLHAIQRILNIGFDSMVFIDDNPFERNMVREHIPGITVPEIPADPADYLEYLYSLNLFETATYTATDADRTSQYQTEAKRVKLRKAFTSEADYLQSLGMAATVSGFNAFNTPRVAQLTQRSNQFNLRTVRYTEADVQSLAADPSVIDLSFTLADKFGDNGLVAVVIMKQLDAATLFIDTWLMSCRVLSRGMEDFTLNCIVDAAKSKGIKKIVGEYIPSPKNKMVANLYDRLGFTLTAQDNATKRYELRVDSYEPRQCYITQKPK